MDSAGRPANLASPAGVRRDPGGTDRQRRGLRSRPSAGCSSSADTMAPGLAATMSGRSPSTARRPGRDRSPRGRRRCRDRSLHDLRPGTPARDRLRRHRRLHVSRNDVWQLSLGDSLAWSELHPAGALPAPRAAHAATLDPARERLVVLGGASEGYDCLTDIWTLDLRDPPAWTDVTARFSGQAPAGRRSPMAITQTSRDRMLVFGGSGLRTTRQLPAGHAVGPLVR